MVYGELGMSGSELVAARRARAGAPLPSRPAPSIGLTAYGCEHHEAVLFRELGPRLGVALTVTEQALSESTVALAAGRRCISVGHKTRVTSSTLLALSRVGVEYVSTRSIGDNHIDVRFAESVGICVEGVTYSPDSVADYTLMHWSPSASSTLASDSAASVMVGSTPKRGASTRNQAASSRAHP